MKLVRRTWSGKISIEKKIVARKDKIVDEVNDFIEFRLNEHNKIPVEKFTIKLMNQHNDKLVDTWEYKPTYRQ